ncbi:MAG: OmpH family outer membrane protein [Chitinophagia bacterium]|jgi:outer membrane protein|nr:OmpH family outer membrane protein [Chitinophagia bacterium]NCA29472.1 OmpH family outer membrane protein [Chitinophagia bacterium]
MKSNNWIFNGVLAVGVVILYILHFTSSTTPIKASAVGGTGTKVAYFEIDSIQNSYEFFKEVKSSLQLKDMENAKELTALKNSFAAKYQDLQKNGRSLSQAEIANRQQELAQLEKNYTNREQQLSQELQEESFKRLQEVKKKIEVFLEKYNKNKEFAYIFSSNADLMYYKDTAYDITSDIIKGLNSEYISKK